jgi:hypothetical protein
LIGCVYTINYWKTHAGSGTQPDKVTSRLPIWIGLPDMPRSTKVTTASQALKILNFDDKEGNGIARLRAQLLAAKLNIASGASHLSVDTTIKAADTVLSDYGVDSWIDLLECQKITVLGWVTILENYNKGLMGPPPCLL